jgi:uncharacterized membrane protein
MKTKEVQEIFAAGLISAEQRDRIVEHFRLDHPHNRFLSVLLALGGVLVLTGIILVISANWALIPGIVKIAVGALLMTGAHFGGWKLRGQYPKAGAALHFVGAGLFLANIALVGQVYHLSARSPNALLFWLVGIVPLVWILRSVSIHVLALIGFVVWLGMEINASDGYLHFASHVSQFGIYAGVGLLFYGLGLALKRTPFATLAPATERIGMLMFHFGLWPTVVNGAEISGPGTLMLTVGPAILGLGLVAMETRRMDELSAQWRNTWLAVLAGWIVIAALWMTIDLHNWVVFGMGIEQAMAAILLVAGCIAQMRVAEELRAPWMVNLAIVTTGYCIIATFGLLIGSMMNTGLIFLVGGVGILGLGFLLEKKRRAVIQRMHA